MERTCYFINVGFIFDKNNKKKLKECYKNNMNCCKSDICNGLWCEDYGIYFNEKTAIKIIKKYVKNGNNNSYGFIKEIKINIDEKYWGLIEEDLENYDITKKDINKFGFIPIIEDGEFVEEFAPYWETPDISFFKKDNKILKNVLEIKKEEELEPKIISWVNKKLYPKNNYFLDM